MRLHFRRSPLRATFWRGAVGGRVDTPNAVRTLTTVAVMEYLGGGEVKWRNDQHQPILTVEQTRRIMRDAILGLEYCELICVHFSRILSVFMLVSTLPGNYSSGYKARKPPVDGGPSSSQDWRFWSFPLLVCAAISRSWGEWLKRGSNRSYIT